MDSQSNLLVRLHKWAVRQDENFLSECLVLVCQALLEREPVPGALLLRRLTLDFLQAGPGDTSRIDLKTHANTDEGRPDIEIRFADQLVLIEVKAESDVRPGQLAGYRRELDARRDVRTWLVLLTRHLPAGLTPSDRPDGAIRWFQIGAWITEFVESEWVSDPVCLYLLKQFAGLLRERGMSTDPVAWELPNGVRALRTFFDMLKDAAIAQGWRTADSVSFRWFGLNVSPSDNATFWVGINTPSPSYLQFSTDRFPIDLEAAARLKIGEIEDGKWNRWADLTGEETYFFCRSAASQRQWLEGFLRECVDAALSVSRA
jgi:hypothetical protein